MARKIEVEIVGDSRKLERAFARSSRSASKFNASITGMARGTRGLFAGFGVALGAGGIVAGLKKTVDAASDLNEEITKSDVIFGSSAKAVQDWSETTAHSFKLSQRESLEAAGNFGAMFRTIGLGSRQTAQMARRLTELGADMASFNNQDPSEMLDRLRSGLAGEAEPLRRFGVLLSEARVQQEAYRSGIARVGAKLTEQQKVQARYNLILQDTKLQQGDAARTGGNWAGVQRELAAQLENVGAKLGQVLLPKLTDVVKKWNAWLAEPENQKKVIDGLTTAVNDLATALEAVNTALGTKGRIDEWFKSHHLGFLTKSGKDIARDVHLFGMGRGGRRRNVSADVLHPENIVAMRRAARRATGGGGGGGIGGGGGVRPRRRRGELDRLATLRNTIFDQRIARQQDRLQDLSLRRQLSGLRAIAQTVRARISVTRDATRRLTLEDKLLDILREQRSVQQQIGDQVRATNAALKQRADAIKAAVLERLQRRQTDILNRRALADAREQLRIARQLGGPMGIREATRALQDVRLDMQREALSRQPATLTRGGQFRLGNVITINVHGVTDPDAVARKVAEVLQRRARRTSPQQRGATA